LTKGGGNESKYELVYEKPFNVQENKSNAAKGGGKIVLSHSFASSFFSKTIRQVEVFCCIEPSRRD
jgi:hypothetical protein